MHVCVVRVCMCVRACACGEAVRVGRNREERGAHILVDLALPLGRAKGDDVRRVDRDDPRQREGFCVLFTMGRRLQVDRWRGDDGTRR